MWQLSYRDVVIGTYQTLDIALEHADGVSADAWHYGDSVLTFRFWRVEYVYDEQPIDASDYPMHDEKGSVFGVNRDNAVSAIGAAIDAWQD